MVVSKDTQMRPWGQCIPQAPRTAHGQMNFVVFAPVCLFPVLPPARQFANPCSQPRSASLDTNCGGRSPGWSRKR